MDCPIYIIYIHEDREKAEAIKAEIESLPNILCCIDMEGDVFERISKSSFVIPLLSAKSMQSREIEEFIRFACFKNKTIHPIIIDDSELAGWWASNFSNTTKSIDEFLTSFNHSENLNTCHCNKSVNFELYKDKQESILFDVINNESIILDDITDYDTIFHFEESAQDIDEVVIVDCDLFDHLDLDEANSDCASLVYKDLDEANILDYGDDYSPMYETPRNNSIPAASPKPNTEKSNNIRVISMGASISCPKSKPDEDSIIYDSSYVNYESSPVSPKKKKSLWSRLFSKKSASQTVFSSVFAPAEVQPMQNMMIQVYLHLKELTDKVNKLALEADAKASRRGFEPLSVLLKKGDKVEIELNIHSERLLYNSRKEVIWQGDFVKKAFMFEIPEELNVSELSSSVNIFVNGALAGELLFVTKVVSHPSRHNTKVTARPVKKLFISYSHKDYEIVEQIALRHEALGIDVFFDKHSLKAGDIFSEEIMNSINNADTFLLCWSENASRSEYVGKERQEAMKRAYPQVKPIEDASLKIMPYHIMPHAEPPADMIDIYHFEEYQ